MKQVVVGCVVTPNDFTLQKCQSRHWF